MWFPSKSSNKTLPGTLWSRLCQVWDSQNRKTHRRRKRAPRAPQRCPRARGGSGPWPMPASGECWRLMTLSGRENGCGEARLSLEEVFNVSASVESFERGSEEAGRMELLLQNTEGSKWPPEKPGCHWDSKEWRDRSVASVKIQGYLFIMGHRFKRLREDKWSGIRA